MRASLLSLLVLTGCGSTMTPDAGVDPCAAPTRSPAVLINNPGFECGEDKPTGWNAIYGTVERAPGEGRSGAAAKLVVGQAGGRFAYSTPIVSDGAGKTYCVQAWVKGTAPVVRSVLLSAANGGGTQQRFAEPLDDQWQKTPPTNGLNLKVNSGESLQLFFEVDSAPGSQTAAKVGDVVYVDDVDVWVSSGQCDESR